MVEQSNAQAEQAGKNNSPFNMRTNAAETVSTCRKQTNSIKRGKITNLLILLVLGVQKESFFTISECRSIFPAFILKGLLLVSRLYQNVFKLSELAHLEKKKSDF